MPAPRDPRPAFQARPQLRRPPRPRYDSKPKSHLAAATQPPASSADGNYSARGRDPDVAAGEFGEDVEGPAAVFGGSGEVGAHRGEVLGAGEGAQAPGHLLLDLHHADVAFGGIVVEGHPRVGGEP